MAWEMGSRSDINYHQNLRKHACTEHARSYRFSLMCLTRQRRCALPKLIRLLARFCFWHVHKNCVFLCKLQERHRAMIGLMVDHNIKEWDVYLQEPQNINVSHQMLKHHSGTSRILSRNLGNHLKQFCLGYVKISYKHSLLLFLLWLNYVKYSFDEGITIICLKDVHIYSWICKVKVWGTILNTYLSCSTVI